MESRSKTHNASGKSSTSATPRTLPHQGGTWRPKDAEAYEEENFRLKKLVAELQAENGTLKTAAKRLVKQTAALQQQQAERHGPADVSRRLRAENQQLQEELGDRTRDLAEAKHAVGELRQQLASRDESNGKLKAKLTAATERADRLSAAVVKNSATTAELKREMSELRATTKAATDHCTRMRQKKQQLKAQLASFGSVVERLQLENDHLQHRIIDGRMERALERYAQPLVDEYSQLHLGTDIQRVSSASRSHRVPDQPDSKRAALSSSDDNEDEYSDDFDPMSDEDDGDDRPKQYAPQGARSRQYGSQGAKTLHADDDAVGPKQYASQGARLRQYGSQGAKTLQSCNSWDDGDDDWQLRDDDDDERPQWGAFSKGTQSSRKVPLKLLSIDDDDDAATDDAEYELDDEPRPAASLASRSKKPPATAHNRKTSTKP
eukprot:TRINITY_DN8124_c0_g1_i2.p1 TRINITY_DN8124_c0_g1~~TRINITY_DN8124_c0_g1_i2.p1  ORF type:complete len:435 (-),score=153.92 TRINITY_DN8124_c0_g1_i2:310-1614(-)